MDTTAKSEAFKSRNGTRLIGDKVLQIFARIAQANLRQTDLVGRLGGEEFVVVLADASIDNAYLVADRLRNAFGVGSMTRRCTRPRASACPSSSIPRRISPS